jgi:hypothetical protein
MIAAGAASVAVVLDANASARADEPCARVAAPATLSTAWAEAVDGLGKQIAQLPASDCGGHGAIGHGRETAAYRCADAARAKRML